MSVLETITIDGETHELPSGASVDVDGDKLVISNHGTPSSSTVNIANFEYSEDERIVGCWTDGKPVYERTVLYEGPLNEVATPEDEKLNLIGQIDPDLNIIKIERVNSNSAHTRYGTYTTLRNSSNMSFIYDVTTGSIFAVVLDVWSNPKIILTIQYTKTTDAPGSFTLDMLGIKQLKPKHTYSTEEQIVGTWIDGKPVYEKFIEMERSIPQQGTLPVYMTDLNAKQLIKATALRVGPSPAVDYACVWTDSNDIIHYKCIDYFSAQSGCSYYIILQYTKTTD